jgi:hypothetical protein
MRHVPDSMADDAAVKVDGFLKSVLWRMVAEIVAK